MQNLLFDELCIKRAKKNFLTFAIACVALISVIYTPIYLLLYSNVLWRGSVPLFLLTELVEPLIDFSFYWGSFAFLIYIYLRFGKKQAKSFAVIYVIAAAARYFLTLFVGYLMMSFPEWETILGKDIPNTLISIAMDVLQMFGVLLIAKYCFVKTMPSSKKSSKSIGGEELLADSFPIEKLFNFKKPITKLCFFSALIPSALKLLSRLYYDIFFLGLPTQTTEWLLMATYYIGDIATLFIGYFVILYLLQTFYTKEVQKKIEFES